MGMGSRRKIPKPIKLSDRISVWKESDLDEWIESKTGNINSNNN